MSVTWITGATGFVGRRVCRQLASQGVSILATGRCKERLNVLKASLRDARGSCEFAVVDPADEQNVRSFVEYAARDVTQVIDLACPVPGSHHDSMDLLDRAEKCARGTLWAIRHITGLRHVTFASTAAIYGLDFEGLAHEDTLISDNPGPYAFHKWLCEQRLRWFEKHSEWTLALVRPSQIYGPGESHGLGVSRMVYSAVHDRKLVVSNGGEDARDLIYVDDAAQAIVGLATARTAGLFNVSSGSAVKIRQMASIIESSCDEPPSIEVAPVSRPATVLAYDNSRLQSEIGVQPAISIAEGVRRCVRHEIAIGKVAKAC